MVMTTAYLITPCPGDFSLRASFLEAMWEFEAETGHADAGGLSVADLESGDCFENYATGLRDGTSLRRGTRPLHTADWWWCERSPGGEVTYLGRASVCHFLEPGGANLNFAIRPSRRGQGHGTALLAAVLPIARARGVHPAYVICDDTNTAACHVIEACGGVEMHHPAGGRRYLLEEAASTLSA